MIMENGLAAAIFHEATCWRPPRSPRRRLCSTTRWASLSPIRWSMRWTRDCKATPGAPLNVDDEGMATQHTQLIKDGVLTGFLVDRMGALKTGYARTGSGRRESYKYAPTSRMRNTYIEPGNHSLDDMLATVEHGIYAKKMGAARYSPARPKSREADSASASIAESRSSASTASASVPRAAAIAAS